MNNTLRQALFEYVEKLKSIYKEYLAEVVLYGSCAKGNYYDKDTDIDIMILVDLDDIEIKEYQNVLTEATYEMFLEKNLYITPIVINRHYFMEWKDSHKFYKKINTEGIRLYKDDDSYIEKKVNELKEKRIKIAAFQFKVTEDIKENYEEICKALVIAKEENIKLIVFPECALTGYPHIDIDSAEDVDFESVDFCLSKLEKLAREYGINILVGAVTKHKEKIYNSAVLLTTDRKRIYYNKRALWGTDKDNFIVGEEAGIFAIEGVKIGVRICFEVRFPEYFRELYIENTDLNIVLFYDRAENDDVERYNKIRSHIITRASENICYTLTANTMGKFQTAPTGLYDKSGNVVLELKRHEVDMLVYEIDNFENDFGEEGRKLVSDQVIGSCSSFNKFLKE